MYAQIITAMVNIIVVNAVKVNYYFSAILFLVLYVLTYHTTNRYTYYILTYFVNIVESVTALIN